jgi:hypothetical protein
LTEPPSIERIVDAYWKNYELVSGNRKQRLDADEWFWAWKEVEDEVRTPTGRTFELLLALVDSAKDNSALAYVGAGPIEELVNWHGATFMNQIEEAARRNRAFRYALSGVRVSQKLPSAVRERLAVFIDATGFIDELHQADR